MALQYGISLSLCQNKIKEFLQEANLSQAYVNTLEYFVDFASANGFKLIELTSFPPLNANALNQIKTGIREKIKHFETICHLPSWENNICALNPDIRKVSIEETKKLIDIASDLGITKISMHPGFFTCMPEIYTLFEEQVKNIARKVIFDILKYCQNKNIQLCLENLPNPEPLFRKPEEFESFVEQGVGLLLDTAHAVTSGVDPIDFIKKFGNKIVEVHLVDGFKGKPDIHYPLGKGEVDYVAVLNQLQKIKSQAPVILELKSEKDTIESLKVLKKKKYL